MALSSLCLGAWLLAERGPLVGRCAMRHMKALPLEEIGMNCGSEVTVPGPLREGPHYPGPEIEPCLCFFPPQLCPSLDG